MKEFIQDCYNKGEIKVYLIIKEGDKRRLKSLNASVNVHNKIKWFLKYPLDIFLEKLDDVKDIKDAYDGTDSIFQLSKKTFNPFSFFVDEVESCSKDDIPDGFALKLGYDDNLVWIYQNIYANAVIRKNNKVTITCESELFETLNNNIISFEKRIDAVVLKDSILLQNIKIIEKKFNYKELIRNVAGEVINCIQGLGIVDDLEKIRECAGEDDISFSKKIMRAKGSPVLKLSKAQLIDKVKNSKKLYKLIRDDEFQINTKEKANLFVRMLNDQILVSELTGESYDATVKKVME